jgi:outer membrane immunogenic protein
MSLRTMQKLVLITLITLSASVFAADKINWTGPYVGFDAGYNWARDSNTEFLTDGAPTDFTAKNKPNGGLLGINTGYNFLSNDKWLMGLGAEFKTYNTNDTVAWTSSSDITDTCCTIATSTEKKLSLLAKLGYLINNKTLFYVNGGWANAEIKRNYMDCCFTPPYKNWQDGWTLGAGGEYSIYQNLTAKIEYRYTDLGDKQISRPTASVYEKQSFYQNELTAGIAYHF